MKRIEISVEVVVGMQINYYGNMAYTLNSVVSSLFIQRKSPEVASILFLGDSNTYDLPNNWTGYLRNNLKMKNATIVQKNGETTEWMKEQLASLLAKGKRYDYVFIWGGVNDIYKTGTRAGKMRAIQNIKDMITMLRKAKDTEGKFPEIVVINIACDRLRDESLRYATNERLSDEFNREMMMIPYARIVPTRDIMRAGKVPCEALTTRQLPQLRQALCRDQLCHLNPKANQILANYIQKYIFKR